MMTQAFPLSEGQPRNPMLPLSQRHQKNKVGRLGIRHLIKAQGKGRIEPLPNPGVRLHLAVLTIQVNGLLKLAGRDSHLDQHRGYDGEKRHICVISSGRDLRASRAVGRWDLLRLV